MRQALGSCWQVIAGVVIFLLAMLLAASFSPTSNDIIEHKIEFTPGQELAGETAELEQWQTVYDLDLTGLPLVPNRFAFDGEQMVAFLDSEQQILITVDLARKNFWRYSLPAGTPATAVTFADDGALLVYANGVWRSTGSDDEWQVLTPELVLPTTVTALEVFDGNFYLFGENMVRKVTMDDGSFAALDDWLDEPWEFVPVSVCLDGYVYVSHDAKVTRLLRGAVTPWQMATEVYGYQYLACDGNKVWSLIPAQETLLQLTAASGDLEKSWSNKQLLTARFLWFDKNLSTFYTLMGQQILALSVEE